MKENEKSWISRSDPCSKKVTEIGILKRELKECSLIEFNLSCASYFRRKKNSEDVIFRKLLSFSDFHHRLDIILRRFIGRFNGEREDT